MPEKGEKKARSKEQKDAKILNSHEKRSKKTSRQNTNSEFSLLADRQTVDPALSSLFSLKQPSVTADIPPRKLPLSKTGEASIAIENFEVGKDQTEQDATPNLRSETTFNSHVTLGPDGLEDDEIEKPGPKRKRKKRDHDEDLEDAYMSRLAREEAKEAEQRAKERATKRQRLSDGDKLEPPDDNAANGENKLPTHDLAEEGATEDEDEEGEIDEPPRHETELAADVELSKANRTIFLGNVSTTAIKSKAARKTLIGHLGSFFDTLPASKTGEKHKIESIRFRSTAYATAIPKKAAYAKQELMDATTKSTNAYVVYSSPLLAREAAKRLNGSIVLDRHIRVDEVAHPAKIDNRRCVFVGNLGFVDDESNIQQANEDDGREKRKRGKEPADIEEGLWRTFGRCGKVESVRVIRDSTTRVGKGIAYIQFVDENSVEAALLYNEKKFPPMLPRKLRVSRARAPKRNVNPGSDRPSMRPATSGYRKKISAEEASNLGRASKILGRAAAAQLKRTEKNAPLSQRGQSVNDGIKKPESFIFEGHRATSKQGKSGLKLGARGKKKARVTKRSASFKAKKKVP